MVAHWLLMGITAAAWGAGHAPRPVELRLETAKEIHSPLILGMHGGPLSTPKVVSELGPLTRSYAEATRLKQWLPMRRLEDARRWRDQAGASMWRKIFLSDSGTTVVFHRSGRELVAYRVDGDGNAAPAGRLTVSSDEPSEAEVLPQLGESGMFVEVAEAANVFDLHQDDLFYPQGRLVNGLKDAGVGGAAMDRTRSLLTRFMGMPENSPAYGLFLRTIYSAVYPQGDAALDIRLYREGRRRHDSVKAAVRLDTAAMLQIINHPRFSAWSRALREDHFVAHGYSEAKTAETLIVAALESAFDSGDPYGSRQELQTAVSEVETDLTESGALGRLRAAAASMRVPAPLSGKELAQAEKEASETADLVLRRLAARQGSMQRILTVAAETLRLLPRKQGPGGDADRLDFVERLYRQAGLENDGGFSQKNRYRYTGERVVSGTSYTPYEPPLPPLDGMKPRFPDLRSSLRHMLTGNARFEDFEAKFAAERPTIKSFLLDARHPSFPHLGDRLRATISPEFVIVEMMDSFSPAIVSRFFPDYRRWEAVAWDRVTYDFVRGVEIQLLRRASYPRFLVRLVSNWRSEDFSRVTDADIDAAVADTLRIGAVREKKFSGTPKTWSEYRFKDVKDFFKKLVFQRIPKTTFLQIPFTWGSYFGIGWTCLCWFRESLFRVTFKK